MEPVSRSRRPSSRSRSPPRQTTPASLLTASNSVMLAASRDEKPSRLALASMVPAVKSSWRELKIGCDLDFPTGRAKRRHVVIEHVNPSGPILIVHKHENIAKLGRYSIGALVR